jgi:asparagine synthase (glutamine-hydrolysing)
MGLLCGIIGNPNKAAVAAAAKAMAHRGPARFVEGPTFVAAGSHGLDDRLLLDGAPRSLHGDALSSEEILERCIACAGNPARLDLRGMFSAVVRMDADRWWLIRDRLGGKPLYYYAGKNFLLFASELQALLASGLVPRHLNLVSLDRYLTLRCVPGAQSIVQNVYRVEPGSVLEYHQGALTQYRFAEWNLEPERVQKQQAVEKVAELLEHAATSRESDGLLWTGGIDSAAIAAVSGESRAYFTSIDRAWQDEERWAREKAKRMELSLDLLPGKKLDESLFAQIVAQLDEPIADPSVFPLWLIFEQVARHAKTVYTGHGADEILAGYPRYQFLQKAGRSAKKIVPMSFLNGLAPALPPNAIVRRASHYLQSIQDNLEVYLALVSVFDQEERSSLYTNAMQSAILDQGGTATLIREHFSERDLTRNLMSLDMNIGIPYVLLHKCDRMASRHGLALQYPYLDDTLLDYVLSLPSSVKYGVRSKPLLRMAMKGRLPGGMRLRAQRGFQVPQQGRVVRVIENVARDVISQDRVEATGLFRWGHVSQVLRSANHNVYRRRQFWALLMFFTWYREIMER